MTIINKGSIIKKQINSKLTKTQRGVNTLRDLKHLIRFEELLRAANNELVKQAQAEGKIALGYNCSYIPEVLLDVEGCFEMCIRDREMLTPLGVTRYMPPDIRLSVPPRA